MAFDASSVQNVKDFPSLLKLLRDDLGWPLPDNPTIDEITFDWRPGELRLPDSQAQRFKDGIVQQIRPLVPNQPFGIFYVEFADALVYRTALRHVVRGLVPNRRRDPALQAWQLQNLLFICTTKDYEWISFAHFKGDALTKAKLNSFGWEHGSHYIHTLCKFNLPGLTWPKDESDQESWTASWAKAFDKEPLTKEFFKRFDHALDLIKGDLEKFQKLKSADAYSRAQLLLERLLFLYFLQRRGWLNQNRDYLVENLKAHRARPNDFSYYEEFVEKLFWSLASPATADNRISSIPFLNGGLFDDDEFSPTQVRKKNNPPLLIRNATFAAVFDDFLEAFHFTVREDTPLNQEVAVDPEMLGKVFESIVLHAEAADPEANAPDKRKATGSYYTPRIVVHFICREVLLQYLANHLPGDNWAPRLKRIFEIDASEGLEDEEMDNLRELLSPREGRTLLNTVKDLKCCDPAVGSGAFPVGLMHELVNLRRVAEAAANGYVDPVRKEGHLWIHDTKEEIVERCLYGVDIQQQAIEICRLRLWLTLIVDYDLGVDPFTADPRQFREAINKISQLPNLEMNFRRGDSLLDHISGVPVIVTLSRLSDYEKFFRKIEKLGRDLHRARKSERKKQLRVDILRERLDLSQNVLEDEIRDLERQRLNITPGMLSMLGFDESVSEAEKRKRIEHEICQADEALKKIQSDRKDLERLADRRFDTQFFPKLRKLEGADFDSPFNFAWRIDFPNIISGNPTTTLAGELAIVNEAQKQQELPASRSTISQSGFDIIVGNPPFVTARNPRKRELYRERWPRVCEGTYLLLCPFFEMSFGILREDGQLGFIVSNAFTKRELGRPLVRDFFPIVDVQKIIDCSGLMFPGHGTPTCIVFGRNKKPDPKSPIRVAAILPGGGDLRSPPEESALWSTLSDHNDLPGYEDQRIAVYDWPRHRLLQWPMSFDLKADDLKIQLESRAPKRLGEFISGTIGRVCFTGADDLFFVDEHLIRRKGLQTLGVARFAVGDSFRNWSHAEVHCISPYKITGQLLTESESTPVRAYLDPWKKFLRSRLSYGETQDERKLKWWEYSIVFPERITGGLALSICEIATHVHAEALMKPFIANRANPLIQLPPSSRTEDYHLLASILNSSAVLFWLKQVCFSKREAEEAENDTYYEFAGGKVEQVPVAEPVVNALGGINNSVADKLTVLAKMCWERGHQLPSLGLKELFKKDGEAYQAWNGGLPGYRSPHSALGAAFQTREQLEQKFRQIIETREQLRSTVIALQEEIDWIVYAAYNLLSLDSPAVGQASVDGEPKPLRREQRPFWLWSEAEDDFEKAVALIPSDWSEKRKLLWIARLAAIRDNEHIRRIERPVYKRRWDEQWKVSNRWMCGSVAYAAEFVGAFSWWLSEKAEWHLEHKAKSGAIELEKWTAALWSDERIRAAWPVVVDCLKQLEAHKAGSVEAKSKVDSSSAAFARFFRELLKDETVPHGIPYAVPWEQLEKKRKIQASVKRIRGKLNVPRERFHITTDGHYLWAGKQ